jgi:AcrR family transcriptional regulator
MSEPLSTRDRIIAETTRLFAAQGIKATTVAQIEQAVGLRKGSGGVHRHFATKDDLIEAVLEAQLDRGKNAHDAATEVPPPTSREQIPAYLELLGRMSLVTMEQSREAVLIILRDAPHIPAELLSEHRDRNYDIAYGHTAGAIKAIQESLGNELGVDAHAFGFLYMSPLIFFRVSQWSDGGSKLNTISDDDLIRTWVTVFTPIFERFWMAASETLRPMPDAPSTAHVRS